jgi:hypothetical protein
LAKIKLLYDMPEYKLYNCFLFIISRSEGLQEEHDLKTSMEQILKLIKSEIKE